jgi:predicted dehydrogenase
MTEPSRSLLPEAAVRGFDNHGRRRRPLRIGIIGTGGMARAHADAFNAIRGVEVAACLDVVPGRAEAFAAKFGIALATQDQARLFEAVDAVSIVTPDRFHAAPTIAALKAGKHVLCEKPLTVTLDEAREVAAAARARPDLIGMVNFTYRRSAAAEEAARLVAAGRLGDLRHVHAHYLQSWLVNDQWGAWNSEAFLWRLQTAPSGSSERGERGGTGAGGVLGDIGVHILDLTTAVAGNVTRVRCDLRTFAKVRKGQRYTQWKGARLDANDSALIELDFAGGALGVVQATRWASGHLNHLRVEVHGTAGALRFDLDESYERLHLCVGRDVQKVQWKTKELKPAPNVWQRFCRAVKTGVASQPDIARGALVQAMLDACVRSDASGAWEPTPNLSQVSAPRRAGAFKRASSKKREGSR